MLTGNVVCGQIDERKAFSKEVSKFMHQHEHIGKFNMKQNCSHKDQFQVMSVSFPDMIQSLRQYLTFSFLNIDMATKLRQIQMCSNFCMKSVQHQGSSKCKLFVMYILYTITNSIFNCSIFFCCCLLCWVLSLFQESNWNYKTGVAWEVPRERLHFE